MLPDVPVTWQVLGITIGTIGALVGVGVKIISAFRTSLGAVEERMLDAIKQSRTEGDEKILQLSHKMDQLAMRQQENELYAERNFLNREAANQAFGRLESALSELRAMIGRMLIKSTNAEE